MIETSRPTRRRGATALEVLIASGIMAAAFLPLYTLLQQSQQVAYLDEFHVLARRRARRAAALLEGHSYLSLLQAATGGPPPAGLDPRLSTDSREVFVPLPPPGAPDVTLETLPEPALKDFLSRSGSMPIHAYLQEVAPGFGRLAVLVTWRDPISQDEKYFVQVRYLEDPFRWRRP